MADAEGAQSCDDREALRVQVARGLGAARVWLMSYDRAELLHEAIRPLTEAQLVSPLDGMPVRCRDLRALGAEAKAQGLTLVADCSQTGVVGCAANRLGADVSLVSIGDGFGVVGLSRDGMRKLPELPRRLDRLEGRRFLLTTRAWQALLDDSRQHWHASSDAAQVVASYLRCHPRVAEVRYPGLRGDPSFEVAAGTLVGGFGPLVDWREEGGGGWQRTVCAPGDPRTQVLELERAFSLRKSS